MNPQDIIYHLSFAPPPPTLSLLHTSSVILGTLELESIFSTCSYMVK